MVQGGAGPGTTDIKAQGIHYRVFFSSLQGIDPTTDFRGLTYRPDRYNLRHHTYVSEIKSRTSVIDCSDYRRYVFCLLCSCGPSAAKNEIEKSAEAIGSSVV